MKTSCTCPRSQVSDASYLTAFAVDEEGKHGSITTMFCAWNAMCGTGLVTIPWAYQQSGIVLGIFLTFVAFAFSFYTCYLVLKTAGNDIDYTDTLWKQFGKKGWTFGMISFIIMFTVPVVLLF